MATKAEAKENAAKSDCTDAKVDKTEGFLQSRGTLNLPRPPPPPEILPPSKDRIDVEDVEVKGAENKSTEDAMEVEALADLPPIPADAGNDAAAPDAASIASGDDGDGDGDGSSPPRDGTPNSSAAAAAGSCAATITAAPPNTNDNGDASAPDTELQGWFLWHALPYDEDVAVALDEWGVECVEQLKMLPREYFLAMFDGHKFIVKETAKLAFDEIRAVPVDLRRCALGLLGPGRGAAPAASRNRKEGAGTLSPRKKTQNLGRGRPPAEEEDALSPPRPFEGQTPPSKPQRHRSNWALDPRLAAAVQEWFDEGPPLNVRGKPMSKREFARMKGIPRSSFVIYTHKDASKRRTLGTPIGGHSSDLLYRVFVQQGLTPAQLEDKILALEPKLTRKEAQYHCRKFKQRHRMQLKAQAVLSPSVGIKDEPTTDNLEDERRTSAN